MIKKKLLNTESHNLVPNALIIGNGQIRDQIASLLKDKGCIVKSGADLKDTGDKYDYIVLVSGYPSVQETIKKYLKKDGKFLFLETRDEETKRTEGVKILKIGDPAAWDNHQLLVKILSTLFSTNRTLYLNAVKRELRIPTLSDKNHPAISLPGIPVVRSPGILRLNNASEPLVSTQPFPKRDFPPVKKTEINSRAFFLLFLLVVFISFSLSLVVSTYLNTVENTYNSFKSNVAAGSWSEVSDDIRQMNKLFKPVKYAFTGFINVLFPLKNISYLKDISVLMDSLDTLLTDGQDLLDYTENLVPVGIIDKNQPGISGDNLSVINTKINNIRQSIVNSKKELDGINLPYFPRDNYFTLLTGIYDKLTAISDLTPLIEKLFISGDNKIYLVLFQNNMELRPTGGFIGSYGLLTFGSGRLDGLTIYDVYSADGQLKGHVDPPNPIRKYLSQPNFFLRDSNFDPDFAVSAEKAAWFLQKETGVSVQGVIGINMYLLEKILKLLGPVRLTDFKNEEITSENFYAKAHYYAENNFFPGSTQKKDFLTGVANNISLRLISGEQGLWLRLLPVIKKAFDEKNILLYSRDNDVQKSITETAVGGRMMDVKCISVRDDKGSSPDIKSCYPDYLSVIEANLGVNKANYFISKSVVAEKILGNDGKLKTTVTLSYKNDSTTGIDQNAMFTNYIRIIIPAGSVINSLMLNNMPILYADTDIETYQGDKTSVGFLIRIAPENRGVVKLSYTSSALFSPNLNNYELIFQKQSGDKPSPFVLSFLTAESINFKPFNFVSKSSKEKEIFYSTDTSVDRVFVLSKR